MDNVHLPGDVPVNYIPSNISSFLESNKPQNFTGKLTKRRKRIIKFHNNIYPKPVDVEMLSIKTHQERNYWINHPYLATITM